MLSIGAPPRSTHGSDSFVSEGAAGGGPGGGCLVCSGRVCFPLRKCVYRDLVIAGRMGGWADGLMGSVCACVCVCVWVGRILRYRSQIPVTMLDDGKIRLAAPPGIAMTIYIVQLGNLPRRERRDSMLSPVPV